MAAMTTMTHSAAGARGLARLRSRPGTGQVRAAWLFLSPAIVVLSIFVVWPMVRAAYLSFTKFNIMQPPKWIGFQNYIQLFHDDAFWNAFANTAVYAIATTVVTVLLALVLAVLLNQHFPVRGFARAAVFLPYIASLSVVAIAWSFLFNPQIGLLSYWSSELGMNASQGWLRSPTLAMPAVIIVGIWKTVGFYTVIYLAGLQSIPQDLYEAAQLDGAGPLRQFRAITVPLLANQTLLITILATITNVQVFDQVYVMTQGGPFFKTETLVTLIYRLGFGQLQFGYASAISWVLVIVLAIIAAIQFKVFHRQEVTL
jgi:ABC-type sugar transport system permease subunit